MTDAAIDCRHLWNILRRRRSRRTRRRRRRREQGRDPRTLRLCRRRGRRLSRCGRARFSASWAERFRQVDAGPPPQPADRADRRRISSAPAASTSSARPSPGGALDHAVDHGRLHEDAPVRRPAERCRTGLVEVGLHLREVLLADQRPDLVRRVDAWTISREVAEQFSPMFQKAPFTTCPATRSRSSTSASSTAGFLPPLSTTTRLRLEFGRIAQESAPGRGRAGEAHHRHVVMQAQRLACVFAGADDDVEDPRRHAGLHRQLGDPQRRP